MILLCFALGCEAPGGLPLGSTAEACADCHPDHADEWAASRHGKSVGSPVFQALLPAVEAAWGDTARAACEGCHAPGHGGDTTIGCVSCHAAVGNHGEQDGRLAVDLDAPLAGPLGAEGLDTPAHRSAPRDLLTDPVLCGTCHTVTGPELLVENTLAELEESGETATCVECHLPEVDPRPLTPETPARPSHDHRFVGMDPPWDTDPGDPLAAETTRALLARALRLEVTTEGGRSVIVTNVGGGHRVPTGVAFLREVWVEVESADGTDVVLRIGDQPTHGELDVALLTEADAVRRGSLAAGESARAALPPTGPLEVHLRARAVRLDVLDALDLGALAERLPVHEVATVSVRP